jgi:hypothetical protein
VGGQPLDAVSGALLVSLPPALRHAGWRVPLRATGDSRWEEQEGAAAPCVEGLSKPFFDRLLGAGRRQRLVDRRLGNDHLYTIECADRYRPASA